MAGTRTRFRRWSLVALSVVAVLAVAVAGTGFWAVQRAFPEVAGEIELPALEGEATVYRDAHGIPQIYADTPEDLFRAQGFVDAQDRFWQMHFNRMTTAGRLAELFGEQQVETDVYLRTMGWRRVAEREYKLLQPDTRAYLDAYSEGVNAYLDRRDGGELGLEFAVLGVLAPDHEVQKWTPVDSLAWLKAMAWDLRGNMQHETERAALLASGIERERVEELYPPYPEEEHPPIVGGGEIRNGRFHADLGTGTGTDTGGTGDAALPPQRAAEMLAEVDAGLERIPPMLGPDSPGLGSNSWVVSGEHTESGLPLLANDPHLGAQMPSVWHQTGLHCTEVTAECPFDVTGFGFAGLPGVVIGHNADIAWGFTNLGPDVADLYLERIEGGAAIVDGEPEPLTTREETVSVAGGEDVTFTVRSTRHGPLLSDARAGLELREIGAHPPVGTDGEPADRPAEASGDGYGVALSWTALEPGTTADSIFELNAADDFASFREAARAFEVPAQNLVYADTEGNIAYQAPGTIPVRGKGDGRWPAPGWDSDYDWQGTVPFDELPVVQNPESGYIVTANQAAVGTDYAHLLTHDWAYGYRSARIGTLLDEAVERGGLTTADMADIQMDNENSGARAVVPHLLDADVSGTAARARDLLADWDFQQDADSAAAAFYNAVWAHLLDVVFDELGPDHAIDAGSRSWLVVDRLLDEPGSPWWEGGAEGGRDAVLAEAMQRAADELTERLGGDPAEWRWGDLHTLTVTHPSLGTSGIGPVEWLFNGTPVAASGGDSTVNATGWEHTEGYAVTTVPSMRMAIDMGDLDAARWIDLTGPSGHAFHPHRQDQTPLWARGETVPMPFTREAVEGGAEDVLTLRPAE
ncbi:penicillin acylase family protein [Streptomonospora litoralis]|uniref:Acyl-homoserine lactone acylase QuiP n=1 Tax=Streptomonospora litoralis TaxID=2498135 RepID=A0A4P6Q464_9ACTN|nr:penicillin acylase family protein [Streptomonospora litoralis]QBI53507.1 Acyl-homoserine lactone acylase QuiP precursor [Streptomonospora litoralis]